MLLHGNPRSWHDSAYREDALTYGVARRGSEAGHGLAGLIGVEAEGSPGAVPVLLLDVAHDLYTSKKRRASEGQIIRGRSYVGTVETAFEMPTPHETGIPPPAPCYLCHGLLEPEGAITSSSCCLVFTAMRVKIPLSVSPSSVHRRDPWLV